MVRACKNKIRPFYINKLVFHFNFLKYVEAKLRVNIRYFDAKLRFALFESYRSGIFREIREKWAIIWLIALQGLKRKNTVNQKEDLNCGFKNNPKSGSLAT